ncbi:MAG: hypothetical protein JWR18_2950 [Segetibacter sp.]|jgi:hypothetical protein|nr:hypothetical protein [Segetibacter sp.]
MKNLILSALLTVAVASSAFATGESKISYFVLNSFKNDFKDVTDVTWTLKTGLAEATFIYNNRKMDVFYNPNGTLFAVSKSVELDELPVNAKRQFAKRYEGYTVKEAIQYDGSEEKNYYISAENEKESVIIKIDKDEQLSVFKKVKK